MVQVQLTAEKGSMFLPCSTDREIRLDPSKSQEPNSVEFLNQAQAHKNV